MHGYMFSHIFSKKSGRDIIVNVPGMHIESFFNFRLTLFLTLFFTLFFSSQSLFFVHGYMGASSHAGRAPIVLLFCLDVAIGASAQPSVCILMSPFCGSAAPLHPTELQLHHFLHRCGWQVTVGRGQLAFTLPQLKGGVSASARSSRGFPPCGIADRDV